MVILASTFVHTSCFEFIDLTQCLCGRRSLPLFLCSCIFGCHIRVVLVRTLALHLSNLIPRDWYFGIGGGKTNGSIPKMMIGLLRKALEICGTGFSGRLQWVPPPALLRIFDPYLDYGHEVPEAIPTALDSKIQHRNPKIKQESKQCVIGGLDVVHLKVQHSKGKIIN